MRKLLPPALVVLVSAWAWVTVNLRPSRHDFGPTVLRGVSLRQFTVAWDRPREAVHVTIAGPHAADFDIDGTNRAQSHSLSCVDQNFEPTSPCPLDLNFRPSALGPRTATLTVIDDHGHRATAALSGEGIRAAECQPILVHCNYVKAYSGTISIRSVDSMITEDHTVRSEDVLDITVALGDVQCKGHRTEFERHGYKGEMDTEIKGRGEILGPGMLAIEFDFREGQLTYILTYACPVPELVRTNIALKAGTSTELRIPGEPADWGASGLVADPQPSVEQGMSPLVGRFRHDRWDPENQSGGYTVASWNLRRP